MKTTPLQIVLIVLGMIAFLYFARSVVLPVVLACVAGMTLKPLIRWASYCHIPPGLSAVVVLCLLVAAAGTVFFQLGRPALMWMNEAPQHMIELRQRVQTMIPRIARFSQAAAAVENLGAVEPEQKKTPTIELNDGRGTTAFINWTGSFLAETGETLVVLYLLLASGDLFSQKLVRVMPTLQHKESAVEISREIQHNISNYLFSVSVINICLGTLVGAGLFFMGVPNALMWGMLVAILNFVPYFGPIAGRPPHVRHGVVGTPSARLVFAPPFFGSELHYAGGPGPPLHAQPGRHLCFVDLLDLALGRARSSFVSADTRLDQGGLRPCSLAVLRQRTAHELNQTAKTS
jgi:predicted PurR-regulated permease PerM